MPFERDHTVPLTDEQRQILRLGAILPFGCLLPVALVMVTVLTMLAFSRVGGLTYVKILIGGAALILAAVIVMTAIHVRNYAHDLRSAVAQVATTTLLATSQSGRAPRTFYAEFERIGTVIVQYEQWNALTTGGRYRVTFSEKTRRAWSIEPLQSS